MNKMHEDEATQEAERRKNLETFVAHLRRLANELEGHPTATVDQLSQTRGTRSVVRGYEMHFEYDGTYDEAFRITGFHDR